MTTYGVRPFGLLVSLTRGPARRGQGVDSGAGSARVARGGEGHGAHDRPDTVRLGHHRRRGLHPRRDHPPRRSGGQAQEEAVQGRLRHLPYHLAEAKHLYQKGAARLLIGAGQHGRVALSKEAATYFARHRCQVELLPTPEVIPVWNQADGAVIGLLHVTC